MESTELYSLSEFKVRNDASYEKDYILGKYGAIPFISSNIEDFYNDQIQAKYIKATRNKRKILIVCCGEQTEQNYFKSFKEDLDIDLDIKFFGVNPKSLIEKTIEIKNKKEDEKNPYIMSWCVFDIDEFTREDFNRAYDLAVKNKIEVAYSNKCFEKLNL